MKKLTRNTSFPTKPILIVFSKRFMEFDPVAPRSHLQTFKNERFMRVAIIDERTLAMSSVPMYTAEEIEEFIEVSLGPKWPPNHVFFTTVVAYSLILVLGLLTNAFVIVTSMLNAKKLSISDWYLLSLALSDLVLLVLGKCREWTRSASCSSS